MIEKCQSAWTTQLELVEGGFVKQTSVLASHQVLVANRARPVMVRPAFGFVPMACLFLVRLEPVRALPTSFLSEVTAQFLQTVIRGRESQPPTGKAFFAGIVNIIILGVCLGGTCYGVVLAVVVGAETAYVQAPDVPLWMSIDDPFCHRFPNPTGTGQSMGTESAGYPKSLHGSWTQQELTIGRESLRSV